MITISISKANLSGATWEDKHKECLVQWGRWSGHRVGRQGHGSKSTLFHVPLDAVEKVVKEIEGKCVAISESSLTALGCTDPEIPTVSGGWMTPTLGGKQAMTKATTGATPAAANVAELDAGDLATAQDLAADLKHAGGK